MTDPWADPWDETTGEVLERDMTSEERELADAVYAAVQQRTNFSDRSMQSKASIIGVSELGVCQERTRRAMAGLQEPEGDKLEAFLGTAVGDHVEDAIIANSEAFAALGAPLRHQLVEVQLTGDGGTYTVWGHPDIVFPGWGILDVKTTDGLQVVRRNGPSRQQQFQRNLYAKGAAAAGLLEIPLEQAQVANVWLDRSGRTKEAFCNITPYSDEVVREATVWLDEVVYNYRLDQEAMKEPPRNWCEKVCGHFSTCRQYDSDVTGLITDPDVVTAALVYDQARAMESRGKKMKEEAKGVLVGLNGYVQTPMGRIQLRTGQKAGSTYTVNRKPSVTLDVRRMKD